MTTDDDKSKREIAVKAVRGTALNAFENYFLRFVYFGVHLILANWYLKPFEFGIVAAAESIFAFATFVGDVGFDAAIRAFNRDVEKAARTHRSMSVIFGSLALILAVCTSFFVPKFLENDPQAVASALIVYGASFCLESFTGTYRQILEKELLFRSIVIMRVVMMLMKYGIILAAAVMGYGFWSLLFGMIFEAIFKTICLPLICPMKIPFGFDRKTYEEFLNFGPWKNFMFAGICARIQRNFDNLMVLLLTPVKATAALGFYNKSFSLANLPTETVTHVLSRVGLSAYCKVQDDRPRLSAAFGLLLWAITRVAWPYAIIIALNAGDLIPFLYGAQWTPMVPIFQVMIVYSLLRTVYDDCGALFIAVRKPKIINNLMVLQAVMVFTGAPLLVVIFQKFGPEIYWGGIGAAVAINIAMLVCFVKAYRAVRQFVDLNLWQVFATPLFATAVVCAASIGIDLFYANASIYQMIAEPLAHTLKSAFTFVGGTLTPGRDLGFDSRSYFLARIIVKALLASLLYLLCYLLLEGANFKGRLRYVWSFFRDKK